MPNKTSVCGPRRGRGARTFFLGDPTERSGSVDTVMPTVVHELFEQWARRTPGAIAVSSAYQSLTYAELDERASRLARFLASRGVGPGVVTGLCLDRGTDLVVAELAVLKAGGAYLPLDPGYPAERLAFMLADTAAPFVLSEQRLRDRIPHGATEIVCLDTDADLIAEHPAEVLETDVEGHDLAYIMYTSGSTGQPKGVLVEHRGIVRLVQGQAYAGLTADDVVAHLASVSFDASTFEVWGALTNGARLAVGPPRAVSVAELGRFLSGFEVSVLWLTAGLFHEVVDADVTVFGGLRLLLAGGDVLSPGHCARVLERFPDLALVNGYGPTEGTTFTACHRITEVTGPVPIGTPLAGDHRAGARRAAATGVRGRALRRWRRCGARLPQPSRSHRRPVRRGTVGRAAVPHR